MSTTTDSRKVKVQRWGGVVTVVLVEGTGLLPKDENGFSDPYVKFQLGKERYKSKVRTTSSFLNNAVIKLPPRRRP